MPAPIACDSIVVRGARVHNLQNVDVDIPLQTLTVITGPSGSGKSSLARDTLFVEGRRQFIETLSSKTRRFVESLERPEVDLVDGLPPTVLVEQRRGPPNPRGTLGTLTEIHDFLRLLYARLSRRGCPRCGLLVEQVTREEILAKVLSLPEGTRAMLLAPRGRIPPGDIARVLGEIRRAGYVRARVAGVIQDVEESTPPTNHTESEVDAVVDRIVVRPASESRIGESLGAALEQGGGTVIVCTETGNGGWSDRVFLTRSVCPRCGHALPELDPRLFNFNAAEGACPACQGLGIVEDVPCSDCRGSRLGPEARACRIQGTTIDQVLSSSIRSLIPLLGVWKFSADEIDIADKILPEILRRLTYLADVGLDFLTLDRSLDSLSGGEHQRARLTTALGSGMTGVCYILDEPSIGLHPRDGDRLISILRRLREAGNTVLVVEHDEAMIRAAERIIDMGSGAGRNGGRIVAQGTLQEIESVPDSPTGRYLRGEANWSPPPRRPVDRSVAVRIIGATGHNLQNVSVSFPLRVLTCVTGVSGSGKSTLVLETLCAELGRRLHGRNAAPQPFEAIDGWELVGRLVEVDQSPLGQGPRATPATYSGALREIRGVFAETRQARQRGFTAARFSYNDKVGRCPECKGLGSVAVEMDYLPEESVVCPICQGARYSTPILEVQFRDQNMADVLAMTIDEAADFFGNHPALAQILGTLLHIGLGYLTLGQPADSLSGGECQRLKLATELARGGSGGPAFFVLDEPTTGLHFGDVERLVGALQGLVDQGHSVLVVEHHLDVIAATDWVIDLGPEGGAQGGRVVAEGPPSAIGECEASHTGRFLREWSAARHTRRASSG